MILNIKYVIFSGQSVLAKRLFQPWFQVDFIWNLTPYPKTLKKYINYGSKLVDGIIAAKMAAQKGDLTFVDKLLDISAENETFTLNDVKVETTTLLMGVSSFLVLIIIIIF